MASCCCLANERQQRVWLLKEELMPHTVEPFGYALKEISELDVTYVSPLALSAAKSNTAVIKSTLLEQSYRYGSILITSNHVRSALTEIFTDAADRLSLNNAWRGKTLFAVGSASSQSHQLFFPLTTLVVGTSGVAAMIPEMQSLQERVPLPCLYLAGQFESDGNLFSSTKRDITSHTESVLAAVNTKKLVVYTSHYRCEKLDALPSLPSCDHIPLWIVFFSPHGVAWYSHHLSKHLAHTSPLNLIIEYVALGPTTAAACCSANLSPVSVCDTPTPQGLVNVINATARFRAST